MNHLGVFGAAKHILRDTTLRYNTYMFSNVNLESLQKGAIILIHFSLTLLRKVHWYDEVPLTA